MRLIVLFSLMVFCFTSSFSQTTYFRLSAGPNFNVAYKVNSKFGWDTLKVYPGISVDFQAPLKFIKRRMEWGLGYTFYQGKYYNGWYNFTLSGDGYGYYKNHGLILKFFPLILS